MVYTLICEPLDNPLLASSFLTLFVHEVGRGRFRNGMSQSLETWQLSDHFRKAQKKGAGYSGSP